MIVQVCNSNTSRMERPEHHKQRAPLDTLPAHIRTYTHLMVQLAHQGVAGSWEGAGGCPDYQPR
jgi:hypothetical protein